MDKLADSTGVATAPTNQNISDDRLREMWRSVRGPGAQLDGPLIRFAGKLRGELQQRLDWLEGTVIPHARKQENANGFQKGWHAALSRISEGDGPDDLAALVPQPSADVDDTLPWPLQMPVWKCKTCGCLWRDNLDDTVSLFNAEQKSCPTCELTHTKAACEIHWLAMEKASPTPRVPRLDGSQATGSAWPSSSSIGASEVEAALAVPQEDDEIDEPACVACEIYAVTHDTYGREHTCKPEEGAALAVPASSPQKETEDLSRQSSPCPSTTAGSPRSPQPEGSEP